MLSRCGGAGFVAPSLGMLIYWSCKLRSLAPARLAIIRRIGLTQNFFMR
jgi:hypothetical protein